MTLDLKAASRTAQHIAHEAAGILRAYYAEDLQESTKSTTVDIVTQADKDAEAVITAALMKQFPDHHIVGEEGGGYGAPIENADYRWYIDPIDGTTNFANKIPMFCVSIALTDRDGVPLLGVVYAPVTDEMFTAIAGQGATLNGVQMRVTQTDVLAKSVLGSGFPYDKATAEENNIARVSAFLRHNIRGFRRMGSAALDLCYVACGRLDGYWEHGLNPWDCLAGALLVLEAGGTVTNYTGSIDPGIYQVGRIVASNGHVHDEMLSVLAPTL